MNKYYHYGIYTAKLHLSKLTGKASHPYMEKIRIIGIFFEIKPHWQFKIQLLLL